MSINAIMNFARTGLATAQAGLRTTSNNIANVNTPGYAREKVIQEAIVSGTQAGGVRVASIERIVDKFLVRSKREATSKSAFYEVANQFHSRIQALLGRPDENNSITGRMTEVFSAFSRVALTPQSNVQKEAVLTSINRFGEEIGTLAKEVQRLRHDASNKMADKINDINALTKRIFDLNPLIVKETVTQGVPRALEEQRAQAIDKLSKLINIEVRKTSNGSLHVSSSGVDLVGFVRSVIKYSAPGTVTSGTNFSPITVHEVNRLTGIIGPSMQTMNSKLVSGEIAGLLHLRDNDLPEIARELSNLASEFINQINKVHNLNTAVAGAVTLTGKNTGLRASDAHHFTGKTTFAVTDASGNLTQKVEIDFATIGSTVGDVIAAVNAGLGGAATLSMNAGVLKFTGTGANNYVSISEKEASLSNRAGKGFSHYFGMNDLVQSRNGGQINTGFAASDAHNFTAGGTIEFNITDSYGLTRENHTITISGTSFNDILTSLNSSPLGSKMNFSLDSNGAFVAVPIPAGAKYNLEVVTDTTSRSPSLVNISTLFSIGSKYKTQSAFDVKVKDDIKKNSNLLGLARFKHSVSIGESAIAVGDQTGAAALQNIENTVINFKKAGGIVSMKATVHQYAAALLADVSARSKLNEDYSKDLKALKGELTQKVEDYSGVNLDEELGNIIIYQNAYSASARLITTAKELYDELLRLV